MDILHIRGGNRLEGSCRIQGSKNAALPILAAAILCPKRCELLQVQRHGVPQALTRIMSKEYRMNRLIGVPPWGVCRPRP